MTSCCRTLVMVLVRRRKSAKGRQGAGSQKCFVMMIQAALGCQRWISLGSVARNVTDAMANARPGPK